jgi:carbonic anhydrase
VIVGLLFTCGLFIRQMSDLKLVAADDSAATADPKIAELPLCKFVRTYLIDGPLFFGAAERFVENIMVVDNIKAIILHMRAVSVMDLTGVETLLSVQNQLKRQGARLVIAELPAQPRQLLERTGAAEKLGAENIFSSYQEAVLDTNKKVLESECQGCKGAKDSKYPPPKDCKLRIAMLDPSNPIGRQIEQYGQQVHTVEKQSGMEWLVPVRVPEEIPNCLRDTPISALLQSHNLGLMDVKNSAAAELVVGMCIDFRKSLRMPKELAFTIRREGANMDGAEFSVALAISKGIRHMALIAHNQCAMANTASQRDDFISTLCQQHGWTIDRAQSFFDDHVRSRNIGNEIDFVMEESTRIEKLFPGLQVVPMLYRVEDTRLYLIHEWFMTHAPDDPIARELQAQSQTTEMKRVEV